MFSALICQNSWAFNKAGDVSLTVAGGYDYFSGKRNIKNTGIPFAALGYNFTDQWGLEALLGFFHTKSRATATYNKNVDGNMVAIDVLYHFQPYYYIQPYVLAGPGILDFNPNGTDAHAQGNINAAVGAQLFIHDRIAFRFEARDWYTFVGGKNDVLLSAGMTFLMNV